LLSKNVKIKIFRTVILPFVLCGSCSLGEAHKLRVFKNRLLRKIFVPQWKDVTGDWRGLHNKEFHDLYSPNIIWAMRSRRMSWVECVVCVRETRNVYGVLLRNPEGKRPLGRPWHRWEDNKVDLKVIVWEGMEWFYLAQDGVDWWAVVNMGTKLWVA
jgi:hypothetical protein